MNDHRWKTTVGSSADADPLQAGRDAARQALEGHSGAGLALAFAWCGYDQTRVLEGIKDVLGDLPLAGGSAGGVMSTAGFAGRGVTVSLLSGPLVTARAASAYGDSVRHAAISASHQCLRSLASGAFDLALLFCSAQDGQTSAVLDTVKEVLGESAPVFGGGAAFTGSGPDQAINSHVYMDGQVVANGLVLVLMKFESADLSILTQTCHGLQPISAPLACTRAQGHYVYEVNGENVFDFYEKYLGRRVEDVGENLYTYPFLCQADGCDQTLARVPYFVEREQQRIGVYPIASMEGRVMSLGFSSIDDTLRASREAAYRTRLALAGRRPALLLAVSCGARARLLGTRTGQEVDTVFDVFSRDVPLVGLYSAAEIAPFGGHCVSPGAGGMVVPAASHVVAQTFCLLAISDAGAERRVAGSARTRPPPVPPLLNGAASAGAPPAGDPALELASLREQIEASEDHLAIREQVLTKVIHENIQITQELKSVNLGLSELNQKNQRLLRMIKQYTPQQTWRRAGKLVEQGSLTLPDISTDSTYLFLDVKGFTTFSEAHTPEEVIRALNAIFDPCTRAIYEHAGDIHKYIGDAIFAIFDVASDAVQAALAITRAIATVKTEFKVRIGIHKGRAIHGNVGSEIRRDNTLIGDAVNLSQRLESNCTPGKILISRAVKDALSGSISLQGKARTITVKGKTESIEVFEIDPQ